MRASLLPWPSGMLKFKVSETLEPTGFFNDLVPISTSVNTKKDQESPSKNDENLVDTFFSLCRNVSIEGSKSIKYFLSSTSLWDLLLSSSAQNFPLINPAIVNYYFSLPDRISAVCKMETDEFFFLQNFISWTLESLTLNHTMFPLSEALSRFVFALEKLDANNFAISKLSKFDGFWDSLDVSLLICHSHSSQKTFLAALFKNLISKNLSLPRLSKITSKLRQNMKLEDSSLSTMVFDKFVLEGSLEYRAFAELLAVLVSNNFIINLCEKVFKVWSNDSWIIQTPFNSQLHFSSCLMCILSFFSSDIFTSDLENSLMNGVQQRLDHSDAQVRLMGTCVAECLNLFHPESENKLDFGLDKKNEIVQHLGECKGFSGKFLFQNSITFVERNPDETIINADNVVNVPDDIESDSDDLKPIASLLKQDSNPPKNSKSPLPKFLPDCLKVLRTNEDAEIVEKVLKTLPETFAASSRLSRQMSASSAFNTLLTISDLFELEGFDEFRHNSLQSIFLDQIVIVAPEIIDHLFKSNKLVLGQKMDLLVLISSSAQTIFASKKLEKSFELAFLESENVSNSKTKRSSKDLLIKDFIDNLCLPLITNSIRNFSVFQKSHVMFLEKFLWLQGILLNYSQNSLTFERIVEKYFDLVHVSLTATSRSLADSSEKHKLIEQIPIQKALLIGISVVLTSWPAGLSVIQFYPRLQEIYAFMDEIVVNGPGFQEDPQLQALGTSVALALQDLTDTNKLLRESADQLSLDFKSVKITTSTPQSQTTFYK